jgi:hypothetical protein
VLFSRLRAAGIVRLASAPTSGNSRFRWFITPIP